MKWGGNKSSYFIFCDWREEKWDKKKIDVLLQAVLTSDVTAWSTAAEHRAAIFEFLSVPDCISEVIISFMRSCQYWEDASKYACLKSAKSAARGSNCRYRLNGNHMCKAENIRKWSVTAVTNNRGTTLRGQMTVLAGGHQSCSQREIPFSTPQTYSLTEFHFSFFSASTLATSMGGKLTYSPHHASGGVTLCQIIMRLLGEGQWGGLGRKGWLRKR